MTGHDLDLDAIRQRAQYLHATGRGAYYVADDARDLVAEVECLRAKLAAAEHERDQLRADVAESSDGSWEYERRYNEAGIRAERAEAALAAVRELRGRLRSSLAAAEQDEPKRDLLSGYVPAEDTTPEITDAIARSAAEWMDDEPKRCEHGRAEPHMVLDKYGMYLGPDCPGPKREQS